MTTSPVSLTPARTAALAAIELTLPLNGKPGQDVQAALNRILQGIEDPRDKGLATELVYGFLRLKSRLDHLVRLHLAKPGKTHPFIQRVLGVAAYELVHLDGIPAHATLSWAVEAIKTRLGQAHANLANAVLRRIQALGSDAASKGFYDSSCRSRLEALSVWYSCPEWLVRLWIADYGDLRALKLLEAQLRPPLSGIRVNALRQDSRALFESLAKREGCLESEYPWLGFDPASSGSHQPDVLDLERSGLLSRQSPAVGDMLSRLESAAWPEPIWDCCSGRGGKATALVEQGHSLLFASDTNRRRMRGLREEIARLGAPLPFLFLADAAIPPLKARPRTILIDAPCSGLGVLSRRPDAKWKRTPQDVSTLAAMQRRVILSSADILPDGGLLVYMTCTMTALENEKQGELIESLGFTREIVAEPVNGLKLREFFWGGVWKKKGSPRG